MTSPANRAWLTARIQEQRAQITALRAGLAQDRAAGVVRRDAALAQIEAVRSRVDEHLARNPKLPHLAPFRQALRLHDACSGLGAQLKADAYVAHDDIPLLSGHMLAERFGGQLVYDAAEFPDRRERFTAFELVWPAPALDLLAIYLGPLIRSCGFSLTCGEPVSEHIRDTFAIAAHAVYNARRSMFDDVDVDIRSRCGVAPGDVLLLYVNTVARASLFENLVEGLSQLDERHHLAVLGSVGQAGLQETLTQLARERGVAERLHFLGVVDHAQMPRVASGADFAVVAVDPRVRNCRSSVHNRYFDALAAGLPILGSANDGARRVFGGEPFYREFDLLDPRDFAAAVRSAGRGEVDRRRIREYASEHAWRETEEPKIRALFSFASTVTMLTIKRGVRHRRTLRIAESLGRAGIAVNIVCRSSEPPPSLPGVRWFELEQVS
jgi:glycosyltransferase involved in cell wall biosynthesis